MRKYIMENNDTKKNKTIKRFLIYGKHDANKIKEYYMKKYNADFVLVITGIEGTRENEYGEFENGINASFIFQTMVK